MGFTIRSAQVAERFLAFPQIHQGVRLIVPPKNFHLLKNSNANRGLVSVEGI
jgi:hypothetical protein